MTGFVYTTASRKRGTIHIGVTNDLGRRLPEHKAGTGSRFTARSAWSGTRSISTSVTRIQWETSLKRWSRQWKVELIERADPGWCELFRGVGW